jgi:UDP-N-acetylglucosamine 2-epimerase (non-hydrolysing)
MNKVRTVAVIFGTRPDTIKLAPIILALQKEKKYFRTLTIATAQHREMLDQVLNVFDIVPDHDLNAMQPRQSLASITRNTIEGLDRILEQDNPDIVLVQGDTTTTFIGSLAAFYRHIPVGHVEAGLRTQNKAHPFPEEINRRLTSVLADLHFAPTTTAKNALLHEHIKSESIFVTGNSVIDALKISVKKRFTFAIPMLQKAVLGKSRILLVTLHRRENWGEPMRGAARAIRRLAEKHPDIITVFPVHLNPAVRDVVYPILGGVPNVLLIEPLDYSNFVNLMARSYFVITDSGGVQEEGPALGKPVLVLREVTERPEAVEFGTAKLVGLSEDQIYHAAAGLLDDANEYQKMAMATNPYGDGLASMRTVNILKRYFGYSNDFVNEFTPGKQ